MMLKPLRTPSVFLALTVLFAGWLLAWTLPTHSMWWTIGDSRPWWLELRQHRPLFWLATTLTGTQGRGDPFDGPIGCRAYTGPVVIRTDTGTRVVHAEALSVILESENVLAAAYEEKQVYIDEFGLLGVCAVRRHTLTIIHPIAGRPVLSFEEVQSALVSVYPDMGPDAGMAPRTRWNFSARAIVHDALALIALALWAYAASGIPRWPVWKRAPRTQRTIPPA